MDRSLGCKQIKVELLKVEQEREPLKVVPRYPGEAVGRVLPWQLGLESILEMPHPKPGPWAALAYSHTILSSG